jgi:hypothetical protein
MTTYNTSFVEEEQVIGSKRTSERETTGTKDHEIDSREEKA